MAFIHDDFMLESAAAQELYHRYAAPEPLIDYHGHLDPQEIACDRRWDNLGELWLASDHYKWRAMRAHGIDEARITGSASWKDKFLAYAACVPHTLRNPLYHWTHLELKRAFGIDTLLSPETAEAIWEQSLERLRAPDFSAQGLLRRFNVALVGTTDDPVDSLEHHAAFRAAQDHPCRMLPTFRPDRARQCADPQHWNAWVDALGAAAGQPRIATLDHFAQALQARHDAFHAEGACLSDHGMEELPPRACGEAEAEALFRRLRAGEHLDAPDRALWSAWVLQTVARLDRERGWAMQLHIGALRNQNTRAFEALGPDTGFDSLLDVPIARVLNGFLDHLEATDALPKTILYGLHPGQFYTLAAAAANFQKGPVAGKIQLGSGWWHLDQLDGMRQQLEALSSLGLLSHFIGMLTDSRSFLSFPRHEYFRRLLCNLLGSEMERGLLPRDSALVGDLVRRIASVNARRYLGFEDRC